ncbi:MAG TPA: YdcF family protein [Burkholderiales bacterium]|nr:YdcF family protein [Burkholderiales bacterium]
MMDWIVLRKIIAGFVLPPTGPLLCILLGLILMRRHRRIGNALAWLGAGCLLVLSLPVVSSWLVETVGGSKPLDPTQPVSAQAIVILGGGVRLNAAEYGGDTLGQLTLERTRYGAYLAKRTGLPLLVTGGVVYKGAPEAEVMRDALQQEFATPVRWVEAKSRDTHENARYSAAKLQADGISRVVLVTHAFDVRRARMEFESAGLIVTPAPTGAGELIPQPVVMSDFLPSVRALQGSYYACYELLALVVKRLLPFLSN